MVGVLVEASGTPSQPVYETSMPVGFRIVIENRGTLPANGLVLRDILPVPALNTSSFTPDLTPGQVVVSHPFDSLTWAPDPTNKLEITFRDPLLPGDTRTVSIVSGLSARAPGRWTNPPQVIHQTEDNIVASIPFVIVDPGTLPELVTGLRLTKLGTGVVLRWDGAVSPTNTTGYDVWRQSADRALIPLQGEVQSLQDRRNLATCRNVPVLPTSACQHARALPGNEGLVFYQVRGVNAAGVEGN